MLERDRIGVAYDRHAARLYRYALMVLGDTASAADVVQQVFAAWLRERRPVEHEDAYLYRAVRNECFTALRRRRRESIAANGGPPIVEPADASATPEERLAIDSALRTLPAEQREVVHLKVFEGMTFQEIADLTGASINTIASRY